MNFFKKFNKLHLKYKDNRDKVISFAIIIAGVSCLIIGSSFAYLTFQAEGEVQTITAGKLVLNLNNESDSIFLNNAVPQSNSLGLTNTPYTVTLTNNGTIKTYYEIRLTNNCIVGNSYLVNNNSVTADVCIPNNYINVAVKEGTDEYQIVDFGINDTIFSGYIDASGSKQFQIVVWLDKDTPNIYQGQTEAGVAQNVIYNGTISLYGRQLLENNDNSGADVPELASNMIPVYYDGTDWKKADSSNSNTTYPWYDYTSHMWANAVTVSEANRVKYLNATFGTTIPMDDINTMWVWIPRFNAVTPSNYNGGTKTNPGAINITFVDKTKTAIDAFTFGTESLSGFWYGKFETSHSSLSSSTTNNNLGCTTETCSNANGIIIKPNVVSLRYNDISNFFYVSRSMEQTNNLFGFVSSEVDTHMSKNNEWGAVAYLTQSIYGRCTSSTSCSEVTINSNSSYITGGNDYKTNINQSTTGTIYGVYDMSGGANEYVMGNYNNTIGSSGFSSMPDDKYYNLYTGTSYTGHALNETSGWYGGSAYFVSSSYPWFLRGGDYSNVIYEGVLGFSYCSGGNAYSYDGSRLVVSLTS